MASVSKQPNGRRCIQFVAKDGKRRSIRLGKTSQRQAESIKIRVEALNSAAITGHPLDAETSRWVSSLDAVLSGKLAAVGLIGKRDSPALGVFLDGYTAMRSDAGDSTKITWRHVIRNLIGFFGVDKPLRHINEGHAEQWRLYLVEQGLADNTVRKRSEIAKMFFKSAMKQKLIDSNPFVDLVGSVRANPDKFHFITGDDAEKLIDACPDAQWRLLLALSRFGGLRCPSEHLALTWDCIDWEHNRITVNVPKLKHIPGKATRVIPLFPELRQPLSECWELAEPGQTHIVTRYRDRGVNLRTQLLKIIRRAGLQPWPKLWMNLRSSRETELAETYPLHVVV